MFVFDMAQGIGNKAAACTQQIVVRSLTGRNRPGTSTLEYQSISLRSDKPRHPNKLYTLQYLTVFENSFGPEIYNQILNPQSR